MRVEAVIQRIKDQMNDKVVEYTQKHCNEKGWTKSNLNKEEIDGMKEAKAKIKNKECVFFKTDKSSKLCVDSVQNYAEAVSEHTVGDRIIDWDEVSSIEKLMNNHLKVFNKMFSVGVSHNHEDRIASASTATNVPPPPLYILRKDHKVVPPGQEDKGPPGRPVCAAREGPNSRMSHFLSKVIRNYSDNIENHHQFKSSEELRAALDAFNENNNDDDKKKSVMFGMDAKQLYPSLTVEMCMRAVKRLIENSDIIEDNVVWWEVSKYIAVFYTPDEIEKEGLTDVIPKRQLQTRRALTINCLSEDAAKQDDKKWFRAGNPNENQKKRMLAMAVAHGVKVVMTNHVYTVGDLIHLQTEGGSIGLQLTGILAEVVMMDWDKRFLEKLEANNIIVRMYGRYVDDETIIAQKDDNEDYNDFINRIVTIANSIEEGIVMEVDICENHSDNKIPILDMKCWIDENGNALYQHYEKPVSTKLVISSRSAHSNNCKRSVHISEIVRRLSNTSRKLDWDEFAAPVVTDYMSRMKQAGYHEDYRKHVLLNALAVYDKKIRDDLDGVCPLNRPAGYQKIQRRKAKLWKKKKLVNKGWLFSTYHGTSHTKWRTCKDVERSG